MTESTKPAINKNINKGRQNYKIYLYRSSKN